MKSIVKYLSAAAIAFAVTACMELEPKAQLADENMWDKPGDFEQFANQFYGWTPNFDMIYEAYIHCDKRSDLVADYGHKNVYSNGTNSVPNTDDEYDNSYAHIRRCCLLLENAAGYPQPDDIRQSVGEAYFFRGWTYFQLLQKFGGVILVDHTLDTSDPLLFAKRNSRTEITDFILSDLDNARKLLKSTTEVADGRVGNEAADALISRVALYEGSWQKWHVNADERARDLFDIAAEASKRVMDSKKFELFAPAILGDSAQKYMFILETGVKSNPANLTKADNKEYIWKTCYDPVLRTIGKNVSHEVLLNAQYVSHKLPDMYLCSDGLPIEKSDRFMGYNEIKSEWKNRDNRMRYTLCRPGDTFWGRAGGRVNWIGDDADIAGAEAKKRNVIPSFGIGYFPQKWSTEHACDNGKESYDYPIIRYAEVLLNYAEAVFERDGSITDDDLDISLNLTRCRVNKSMPKLSNSFVSSKGLDMREEIRRERTVELFQEGFRIDDLKRWKTAEIEMPMDFAGIRWIGEWKTKWSNPGLPTDSEGRLVYESGRVWEQKHYLYPLPVDQQQLNKNLKQNPGWPAAN